MPRLADTAVSIFLIESRVPFIFTDVEVQEGQALEVIRIYIKTQLRPKQVLDILNNHTLRL